MATARTDRRRGEREARERARLYQARLEFRQAQARRRRRDTVIAIAVGGAVIVGAIASQFAYFEVGPGVPAPEPTASMSTTPDPADPSAPAPGEIDAP